MVIPFLIIAGGRGAGGGYGVRAQAAGRSAEASLELPELSGDPATDGAALGRALLAPALRQLLLDVARGADEAGARIQIQLRVTPELSALPWEWMSLGGQTLWQPAIREDYALVRMAQVPRPAPPTLAVAAPLRLLIVAASGGGAAAEALGAALAGEVRARRLIIDRLRDGDPTALAEALDEEPCHLLHLIAPATPGMTGGPARAALPRLRLGRGIDPPSLAGILGEHPELRLVTLASDDPESAAPLAALAAALHEGSGLATLSVGPLDGAAAEFCAICYSALAAAEPADLAVTYGRAQLADSGGPWGAPQLFVAPGGEALFRIGAAAPDTPARPPRPARPAARRPERTDETTQPVRPIARPQPRPALADRAARAARTAWLTPRLIVLVVASLILILMVSQVIRRPEDVAAPTPMPAPTALSLPTSPGLAPPTPTR